MPKTYQDGVVEQVIGRRVCARCYGDLVKVPAPNRMWALECPACGDAWHGATVSRAYAVRLGQRAANEYLEVKYNPALKDLFPREQHSEADLLKDLGF